MESFRNADGKPVVLHMIETIKENAQDLSDIDGKIGDGDHGVNMNKGFTMCGERLASSSAGLSESLKVLGRVLLAEIGGSMGPLYGTFFNEMAKASKDAEVIDAELFAQMLDKALAGVVALGSAKVGDKTMLDALVPADTAFKESINGGASFAEALSTMALAAERGKESTRDLVAKVGRSARLGERSRGVLDAGATSCALLLGSMASSMSELLSKA